MVMLSGMLIVILGIGMLFFYQKQVERRMKLEFDIHRRLAAKSGFNLVQYSGTGTYVYAVAENRPVILVTVGTAKPVYDEEEVSSFVNMSNWVAETDGGRSVAPGIDGAEFEFSTTNAAIGQRNELVFSGTNDVAWNDYPFGLCYDVLLRNAGGSSNSFPWVGYVYVGVSNDWNQMFITNAAALLAVFGVDGDLNKRRLDLYEHTLNPGGMPTNSISLAGADEGDQMLVETELYLDGNHIGFGSKAGNYVGADLPPIFSSITNVTMGVGGFNRDIATNRTLNLSKFVVRNPYEDEIYLSWTNGNRYFGTTNIIYTINVLATVVDVTPDKKKFYFFDSFETVVP